MRNGCVLPGHAGKQRAGLGNTRPGQIAGGTAFYLTTGRIDAADEAALRDAAGLPRFAPGVPDRLEPRAQAACAPSCPVRLAVALLHWAAEQEVGHRGFLELGGARLVNQAIEAADGSAVHFGDRLCDVLGVAEAEQFLRFVLRSATDCLIAHRSPSLLRDRIRAELGRHFSNERRRLLRVAADHAGLIFELASLVRDGVLALGAQDAGRDMQKRARGFEHDADRLVAQVFEAVRRRPDYAVFGPCCTPPTTPRTSWRTPSSCWLCCGRAAKPPQPQWRSTCRPWPRWLWKRRRNG